jgi:hypothetical protein
MSPDLELKSKRPQHLCASCGLPFEDSTERRPVCPACIEWNRVTAESNRFANFMRMASTMFRARR